MIPRIWLLPVFTWGVACGIWVIVALVWLQGCTPLQPCSTVNISVGTDSDQTPPDPTMFKTQPDSAGWL